MKINPLFCRLLVLLVGLILPAIVTADAPVPVPAPEDVNNQAPLEESVPDATKPRPLKFSRPGLIEFHGEINYQMEQFFKNRFEKARRDQVDLLIVEIDSPGGLKNESLQMARMLRDCDWAYTVALIQNKAISGGALVSLGCDEILIAPNAKYGDIGEISFDIEQMAWRLIEPKVESYLSRDARDLAQSKGRSPELAEAMIDKDVLIYYKFKDDDPDGKLIFKSVRSDVAKKPGKPWQLVAESGPERFLTLSGQRAKQLGLAQNFSTSREDAAKQLGINLNQTRIYKRTTKDAVVYYLNYPLITGLLVVIGLIALYIEFSAPGIGAGGLIAGLCAVLFFWSRFLGGTSGWLEVILFGAGLIFLMMEIFVIPGFGVSGLAGLVLLFFSIVLASQDFAMPATAEQWNTSLTTILTTMISGVVFLVAAIFITKRFGALPIFNRLVLSPPVGTSEDDDKDEFGKPAQKSHPEIAVGDWGESESLLRPAGRARFHGRSFDVISDGSFVEPGTNVKVIRIHGNAITVASVEG